MSHPSTAAVVGQRPHAQARHRNRLGVIAVGQPFFEGRRPQALVESRRSQLQQVAACLRRHHLD